MKHVTTATALFSILGPLSKVTFAATVIFSNPLKAKDLKTVLISLLDGVITVAIPLTAFFLVWMGFKILINRDVSKIADLRKVFLAVLVGIFVLFSAKGILLLVNKTVTDITGVSMDGAIQSGTRSTNAATSGTPQGDSQSEGTGNGTGDFQNNDGNGSASGTGDENQPPQDPSAEGDPAACQSIGKTPCIVQDLIDYNNRQRKAADDQNDAQRNAIAAVEKQNQEKLNDACAKAGITSACSLDALQTHNEAEKAKEARSQSDSTAAERANERVCAAIGSEANCSQSAIDTYYATQAQKESDAKLAIAVKETLTSDAKKAVVADTDKKTVADAQAKIGADKSVTEFQIERAKELGLPYAVLTTNGQWQTYNHDGNPTGTAGSKPTSGTIVVDGIIGVQTACLAGVKCGNVNVQQVIPKNVKLAEVPPLYKPNNVDIPTKLTPPPYVPVTPELVLEKPAKNTPPTPPPSRSEKPVEPPKQQPTGGGGWGSVHSSKTNSFGCKKASTVSASTTRRSHT